MARPTVQIYDVLLKRLQEHHCEIKGSIFGLRGPENITLIGLLCERVHGEKVEEGRSMHDSSAEEWEEMMPAGMVRLGVFHKGQPWADPVAFLDEFSTEGGPWVALEVNGQVRLHLWGCPGVEDGPTLEESVPYDVVTSTGTVLVRIRGSVPLVCPWSEAGIEDALGRISQQLQRATFKPKGKGRDTTHPMILPKGQIVGKDITIQDLARKTGLSKGGPQVDYDLLIQTGAGDAGAEFSPVIEYDNHDGEFLDGKLNLDTLALLEAKTKMSNMWDTLKAALERNLNIVKHNIDFQTKSLPHPCHFDLDQCGHWITVVLTHGQKHALSLGQKLLLNKPLSTGCALQTMEKVYPGILIDPHTAIPVHPGAEQGWIIQIIKGKCAYFHYMQHGFDDNGWGCAYRSLQTLCSWFNLQGHSNPENIQDPIPTHLEIQKALVKVGDKAPSFIGSKKWIGSTEVGFCLIELMGVAPRFLSVSSGEQMPTLARQLAKHFRENGGPVMIGGGVLAHTIIGVSFNEETGDAQYLVLDPHYTGADEIGAVIKGGWCGWKKNYFWNPEAFYNLCLPQLDVP